MLHRQQPLLRSNRVTRISNDSTYSLGRKVSVLGTAAAFATLLALGACSANRTTHAGSAVSVASDRHAFSDVETQIDDGAGNIENLGVRRWRVSAEHFMRDIPLAAYSMNPEGYITSFGLALPPAAGVTDAPVGVALSGITINARGELAGWTLAAEAGPLCTLKKILIPPATIPTYYCETGSCSTPNTCIITYVYDENSQLKTIRCDCEVVP